MAEGRFDAVVVGVGGMGSAALYHLARRGLSVCGLEQYELAHDQGSSHGRTRIIRKAYFEHPDYVPLLHRAYELWNELERQSGRMLVERCGFLALGPPGSRTIRGLRSCYRQHALPHERLDAGGVAARWPRFRLPAGTVGFLDPLGGFLRAEECVRAHARAARRAGATLLTGERMETWQARRDGFVVRTHRQAITCRHLVVTTGAWSVPELARLGVAMEIWRKPQLWYDFEDIGDFRAPSFPTYYMERDDGHFYGFPAVDPAGLKVAEHEVPTPVPTPEALHRELVPADETPVRTFLEEVLGVEAPRRTRFDVCMYTVSPDRHFIVDRHPRHRGLVMGAGFSGHGFKFAPVVGEILAELVVDGRTRHPAEFLALRRFRP